MNRFIKRNILLVTFFAVALIGMLVMMGLTIWQYVDMRTATGKAEELGKTIDSLSAQSPAPSKENIQLIKEDLGRFQTRLDEVQVVFGQPFKPAVKSAYAELGLYRQAEKFFVRAALEEIAAEREMTFEDDAIRDVAIDKAVNDAFAAEISDIAVAAEKLLVAERLQNAITEMSIIMTEEVPAEAVERAVQIAFEKTYFSDDTIAAAQSKLLNSVFRKAVENCGTLFADGQQIADAVAAAMEADPKAGIETGSMEDFTARVEVVEDKLIDIAGKNKVLRDAFRRALEKELDGIDSAVLVNASKNIEFASRMNDAVESVSQIAALQREADVAQKRAIVNSINRAKRDVSIEDRKLALDAAALRERVAAAVRGFLGVGGNDTAAVTVAQEKINSVTPAALSMIYAGAEKEFYDCFLAYWTKGKEEGDDNRTIFQDFKISREMQREAALRRAAAEAAEAALLDDSLSVEEMDELYDEAEELEEEDEEELEDDGYRYYWTVAEWNKAMDVFQTEARNYTRLPILNSEEIFFFALGVPRDFAGTDQAKKMVETLQTGLQTYYEKNYIGLEGDALYFGMPGPSDLKLTHAQLGYVGDVIEIISDLGVRIAGPQRPQPGSPEAEADRDPEHIITALSEFSRIEMEEEDDEYDIYRFRVKVYSNMSGVMGIINRLNSAVDERRFYMIRRMDIKSYIDEAHEIRYEANLDDEATQSIVPENGVTITGGVTGISRNTGSSAMPKMPGTAKREARPSARSAASRSISTPGAPGRIGLSGSMDSTTATSRRRVRESQIDGQQGNNMMPGGNVTQPGMPGMPGVYNANNMQQPQGYYDDFGQFVYVEEEREEDKPLAERAEYAKPVIGDFTEMDVEFIIDYYIVKNSDFDNE